MLWSLLRSFVAFYLLVRPWLSKFIFRFVRPSFVVDIFASSVNSFDVSHWWTHAFGCSDLHTQLCCVLNFVLTNLYVGQEAAGAHVLVALYAYRRSAVDRFDSILLIMPTCKFNYVCATFCWGSFRVLSQIVICDLTGHWSMNQKQFSFYRN